MSRGPPLFAEMGPIPKLRIYYKEPGKSLRLLYISETGIKKIDWPGGPGRESLWVFPAGETGAVPLFLW